ncbi:hypothetical protein V5P93_002154 [Actinokineospora auranticolor]|uniref:Uncharacterized protein n=1 Tax=Actinokineospora auranticolor TaxID=155976 RepID=A0A2S6GBE5_9PSEU|nr:hypothetical protein [Actinokineospora auranticolor]PPK60993.1 hypothetical protein CLV40_1457 [Actinokineospora auranticolor]
MNAAASPDDETAALFAELKALRKGLGVNRAAPPGGFGPRLRGLGGVTGADSAGTTRDKIIAAVRGLVASLAEPHRSMAEVALGFKGAPDVNYTTRIAAYALERDRDRRTIQRRSDEALRLVAAAAAEAHDPWHTTSLRDTLRLAGPGGEVTEARRIISHRAGLAEIEHSLSVIPTGCSTEFDPADLDLRVLSGGALVPPRRVSGSRVAFGLVLPRPLAERDEHEFEFRLRLPAMSRFYVCTPHYPCDRFELRVHFGGTRPRAIGVLDGVYPHEADDLRAASRLLPVADEVVHVAKNLLPYRSYGLVWS